MLRSWRDWNLLDSDTQIGGDGQMQYPHLSWPEDAEEMV